MNSENLKFYEDDEGMAAELVLPALSTDPVQCINPESATVDEKMKNDIDFLIAKQTDFAVKIEQEAEKYCIRVYGQKATDLTLVKVYLSPDEENEYGFMYSTSLDNEHGVGMKFSGLDMKKIGSSETAFL
ncbi:hypothetical protein PUG81_27870 [Erwiniaceae bacterium L1_54_6]|jgi:hypothetical protein|uniref:hypothetical protein n=1 Tax=Pantoea sp. (strain At-9b) TaxID=592316 RepID=UPI0001B40B09|nr:hypothetical protein [Pantoea sp. At-9b]ADU72996.1 conserved hypothetical protein [Pantoea sp. At-9b]MDF7662787.1 hypothetical protein [Erwiniaceae bacterium L1_54_6]